MLLRVRPATCQRPTAEVTVVSATVSLPCMRKRATLSTEPQIVHSTSTVVAPAEMATASRPPRERRRSSMSV